MKRNDILESSAELFLVQGIKKVSMDDIAEKMSISKKTIYVHFKSKKELVRAIADSTVMEYFGILASAVARSENPLQVMAYYSVATIEWFSKMEAADFLLDLHQYMPDHYNYLLENVVNVNLRVMLKENLQSGIREGYYRQDIDVDTVVALYLQLKDLVLKEHVFGHLGKKPKVSKQINTYHLRGIVRDGKQALLDSYLSEIKQ